MKRDRVQGEGNYESAAVYQRKATRFARGADTEELAREAALRDATSEAQAMEEAERRGRERSKGEDPGPSKERKTLRLKKKKT